MIHKVWREWELEWEWEWLLRGLVGVVGVWVVIEVTKVLHKYYKGERWL